MKIELKISKEIKQLFRGLSSAKSTLQGMQFFIGESFVDIGGIDTGRVKLSMLRIPHKTKKPIEPIVIESSIFLSMITHLLDNETITIEDYKRDNNTGVRIICNDREFTFTEDCAMPPIKPYSLDRIYHDIRTDYEYEIITYNDMGVISNIYKDFTTKDFAEKTIKANPDIYKHAEIKKIKKETKQDFIEFSMEWKEWSYILRELDLMGFDTFDFSTRNGELWIDAEGHYYTYKRKVISLSKCSKKAEITKVTFALNRFDRNLYQPIKINVKDDDPICLTFEHEGIMLRQWIAPRIKDEDDEGNEI
jgi:hypothetical protein